MSLYFHGEIEKKWTTSWQNQQNGCAPSEDLDQLGDPPSLIRFSTYVQWVAKDPSFLHADSEDSDQTGQMPRLVWVLNGHTKCHAILLGL